MSNALNHHRNLCKPQPAAPACGTACRNWLRLGQQRSHCAQPALAVQMAEQGEKSEKGDSLHGLWLFKQLQPHQRFTDVAAGHRVSALLGQRPVPRTALLTATQGSEMSQPKDAPFRLIELLSLIPREPQRIATTTLREKLAERGYQISQRSLQRDLNKLSGPFSLQSDESSMPYRWSMSSRAKFDLAAMDTPTALALYLAEGHLNSLLPQSVLEQLTPQFRKARTYLDELQSNGLAHWARRVRALPNGKALLPAEVAPEVWAAVSTALLERKQLRIHYRSRSKAEVSERLIHPAGLISRHAIGYLLASVDGYSDVRQFALHRIQQAECLELPANEQADFSIDHYIRQQLNTSTPIEQVQLIADVAPQIAWLLSETPLSAEQRLEPLPNSDWHRLQATVANDQETQWWAFSLGENMRIHQPQTWVQSIRERIGKMGELYV